MQSGKRYVQSYNYFNLFVKISNDNTKNEHDVFVKQFVEYPARKRKVGQFISMN